MTEGFAPGAAWAGYVQASIERQKGRQQAAGAAGDIAADRADVAHCGACYRCGRSREHRQSLDNQRIVAERRQRRERPDADDFVVERDAGHPGYAPESDQSCRLRRTFCPLQLQCRAAGDQTRIPEIPHHAEGIPDGRRMEHGEGGGGHRQLAPIVVPKRIPFSFSQRR